MRAARIRSIGSWTWKCTSTRFYRSVAQLEFVRPARLGETLRGDAFVVCSVDHNVESDQHELADSFRCVVGETLRPVLEKPTD